MNRPYPATLKPRNSSPAWAVVLMLALVPLILAAGCGGKDKDEANEQAQGDRPHSLVPANLDSLIAETGATLVQEEVMAEPGGQLEVVEETETALVPEPEVKPVSKKQSPAGGSFSLQVGSFRREENAVILAKKIKDLGYPSSIEIADVGGLVYHRVFVRGFGDRVQAEKLGEELRSELDINYLVLRQQ